MSYDMCTGVAGCVDQCGDIPNKMVQLVSILLKGPTREVVSAHVWYQYGEASSHQRGNLPMPGTPIFRKTMEQNDGWSPTGRNDMQIYAVSSDALVPKLYFFQYTSSRTVILHPGPDKDYLKTPNSRMQQGTKQE